MTESEKIAEEIWNDLADRSGNGLESFEDEIKAECLGMIAAAIKAGMEQARAAALEEAAKLCDANAHIHHSHGESTWGALAESQAIEIRALKPGGSR